MLLAKQKIMKLAANIDFHLKLKCERKEKKRDIIGKEIHIITFQAGILVSVYRLLNLSSCKLKTVAAVTFPGTQGFFLEMHATPYWLFMEEIKWKRNEKQRYRKRVRKIENYSKLKRQVERQADSDRE